MVYENGISNGAPTGTYPAELNRILARAFAYPHVSASDEHWATIAASFPCEIVMPVDTSEPTEKTTGPSVEDITEVDTTGGITGDRRGDGEGATVVRGHSVNARKINSRQVHETYIHKPAEVLRGLPEVCSDVSSEWGQLLEFDNEACPDCIAGKHTHFGSNSHLPAAAPSTRTTVIVAFGL